MLKTDFHKKQDIANIVLSNNSENSISIYMLDELHKACPNHKGDWYFTGDYPTLGGNKVVNKAFVYYIEGNNIRAY